MLTEFIPSTTFVPATLDATKWANLKPLYDDLLTRELHCKKCLETLIADRSELDAAAMEASSRLYIRMTCRTDDDEANRAYDDFVTNVMPPLKEVSFALDRQIMESGLVSQLDGRRYEVLLRDLKAGVELFRKENIPLETELSKLDQEYSQVYGGMMVDYRGREYTMPQMMRFQDDLDRGVREETWRAVAERRTREAERVDGIFDRMISLRGKIAHNSGMPDYRAYMFKQLRRFDYTPETCHEFARGVKDVVVPRLRQMTEKRRASLGLASVRPWDTHVDPQGRASLRPFENADELVERTGRAFERMDPELAGLFQYLSRPRAGEGCLDLASRKGKAPGGYHTMRDRVRMPFIFMNAAGMQRDVETLFHEAGHAFHSLLARDEPILHYRSDIPSEFAEVASMSMELLAHPYLDEFYSPEDADRARRTHLERIAASMAAIAHVDQFQHWLYAGETADRGRAAHDPLDHGQRYAEWRRLAGEYDAGWDWSGLEQYLDNSWQRVLHMFGVPFYYIEYGIAQLGAIGVWKRYREDPAGALAAYKRALALGSSRPLPELFKTAGIPFDFSPAAIRRLWGEVDAELAKLPE